MKSLTTFLLALLLLSCILAWLQTLPEFAVEAVLAWKQQTHLLVANLTGALRLLTGLGWPMIYFVAAMFYRRRHHRPLGRIRLERGERSTRTGTAGSRKREYHRRSYRRNLTKKVRSLK